MKLSVRLLLAALTVAALLVPDVQAQLLRKGRDNQPAPTPATQPAVTPAAPAAGETAGQTRREGREEAREARQETRAAGQGRPEAREAARETRQERAKTFKPPAPPISACGSPLAAMKAS
jgi:hypothetical protein